MQKLSKTAVQRTAYQRHPQSTVKNNKRTMWYTERLIAEGNRSYIKLHAEDKDYIYFWLQRFLADYSQIQYIEPAYWDDFYVSDKQFGPMGREYQAKNKTKYNSINSLVAGLLSNIYRNPDVDFTKKQLNTIKKLFKIICNIYTGYHKLNNGKSGDYPFKIGYSKDTGMQQLPNILIFREA